MIGIGESVRLTEAMLQYMQPQDDYVDTERTAGLDQVLTVHIVDAVVGPYLVLQTERWAIEDVEAFAAGLRELLHLVEPEKEESKKEKVP